MSVIICLIGLLLSLALAVLGIGKGLDYKYKDECSFIYYRGNGFCDIYDPDPNYKPIIKYRKEEQNDNFKNEEFNKHFKYVAGMSFIVIPFVLTVKVLLAIGRGFHLSYNAVNIIVWYMFLPLAWAAILDYKLHQILFAPLWLLLCIGTIIVQRKRFNQFCDSLFKLSQSFILLFGNYFLWSVIICLIVPIVITVALIIA